MTLRKAAVQKYSSESGNLSMLCGFLVYMYCMRILLMFMVLIVHMPGCPLPKFLCSNVMFVFLFAGVWKLGDTLLLLCL